VEFVRRKPKDGPGEFSELFTWNMRFAPMETRTLTVQYRIPMTMGLISTQKDEKERYVPTDPFQQELLNIGMEEVVGYITSTGSSWAGNVENATFKVITEPFERYLNVRGVGEEPPISQDEKPDKEALRYRKAFPVRHPWWFRTISPAGWTKVENGIQWRYKDYKPKYPIVVSYYMTEFPRLPEEVSPFVDQFLENLSDPSGALSGPDQLKQLLQKDGRKEPENPPARQTGIELRRLKQLVLATYGKEPEDEAVKQHVVNQLWYEPRKDFSMESLSKAQKAVVEEFDARIAKAEERPDAPKN